MTKTLTNTNASQRLTQELKELDVARDPGRVAAGAALLEQIQEHDRQGERLLRQVADFLSGTSEGEDGRSLADRAEEVLTDNGAPMRYREIAAEIRGRGFGTRTRRRIRTSWPIRPGPRCMRTRGSSRSGEGSGTSPAARTAAPAATSRPPRWARAGSKEARPASIAESTGGLVDQVGYLPSLLRSDGVGSRSWPTTGRCSSSTTARRAGTGSRYLRDWSRAREELRHRHRLLRDRRAARPRRPLAEVRQDPHPHGRRGLASARRRRCSRRSKRAGRGAPRREHRGRETRGPVP